ncbi:response regulator [bacterium]|nr:response regulator [bacterium]
MTQHRILFVDDEENILHSLKRTFRKENYDILLANSAKEALKLFDEKKPIALVISDQRMPEITGTEFLKQVKEISPDTIRIMLTGYADINATMDAINKGEVYRFITKPWRDAELKLTVREGLEHYDLVQENKRLKNIIFKQNELLRQANEELEEKVLLKSAELVKKNKELEKLNQELEESIYDVIKVFASLIEMRDYFIGSHSKRVASAAKFIAEKFALPSDEVRTIEFAAILHDIGKIGISDDLLRKDRSTLTRKEIQVLQQHPILGQSHVLAVKRLEKVSQLIRHHHEYLNGTGYPDHLRDGQIPLGARIICVVNDYDNLIYRRAPYHKISEKEAIKFLQLNRNRLFDSDVIDHFLTYLEIDKETDRKVGEIKVNVKDLKENMVLSRDLYTAGGVLLAPKGEVLKRSYIERIQNYHEIDPIVDGVYIRN